MTENLTFNLKILHTQNLKILHTQNLKTFYTRKASKLYTRNYTIDEPLQVICAKDCHCAFVLSDFVW